MPSGHPGLPRPSNKIIRKTDLLALLEQIDSDQQDRDRILNLENNFRDRIQAHSQSLPLDSAEFKKFNTSPFVLLMHALHRNHSKISHIEADILPAKLFSSMETSAGRMIEAVMLPAFGWEVVESEMHSVNSALDGRCIEPDLVKVTTLKSGPRCLNDEMSENFADAIIGNDRAWASDAGVNRLEFTYGVLYGTPKLSNKKDWHILRNIREKLPEGTVTRQPDGGWSCAYSRDGLEVEVTVRIGQDWWSYLGGNTCFVELCTALIRACVQPGESDPDGQEYQISDLAQIVSTECVLEDYNVSLLQRSQLPWLFLIARHFCDQIVDG